MGFLYDPTSHIPHPTSHILPQHSRLEEAERVKVGLRAAAMHGRGESSSQQCFIGDDVFLEHSQYAAMLARRKICTSSQFVPLQRAPLASHRNVQTGALNGEDFLQCVCAPRRRVRREVRTESRTGDGRWEMGLMVNRRCGNNEQIHIIQNTL